MSGTKNILVRRTKLFAYITVTSLMTVSYSRPCGCVITWKYFTCMVEQKHGLHSMIFHEFMYHNMRIHVIFLVCYFLRYPNLIRHQTTSWKYCNDQVHNWPRDLRLRTMRKSKWSMIVYIIFDWFGTKLYMIPLTIFWLIWKIKLQPGSSRYRNE